ncbi:MAG: histone deacetylase [Actinobacteria bacterium]|nr:histone deacetylase [Actinomycetota bacterium]
MVALSVYFHERFLDHDTGAWHPESSVRLVAARRALASADVPFEWREPSPATTAQVARVHAPEYIQSVERLADRSGGALDMDTHVSPASYEAALLAAGAGVEAVKRAVSVGERAFLLVRPPGHHAVRSRGMGFCIFNNVAVAAAYARAELGVERVLIFDWDVHHGNGTQDAFYQDPTVLYASMHLRNHYPGTGAAFEVGAGPGKGFTMNVPLSHGAGDGLVKHLFEAVLEPMAREFRPGLVLISSGYDSQQGDPLGGLRLSADAFHWMALRFAQMADELEAAGPVCFLEGGYEPELLAGSVVRTLEGLAGRVVNFIPEVSDSDHAEVTSTVNALREHWSVLDEVH